jgi:hypothetical protein
MEETAVSTLRLDESGTDTSTSRTWDMLRLANPLLIKCFLE